MKLFKLNIILTTSTLVLLSSTNFALASCMAKDPRIGCTGRGVTCPAGSQFECCSTLGECSRTNNPVTGATCYQDCLAIIGNSPSECKDLPACPNNVPTGNISQSGTSGNTPMINLNNLISGMGDGKSNISKMQNLGAIISAALPIIYMIAGLSLFILLIFSGLSYLTSAGDPKKMEAAKNRLTTALIGFVVIIVAFWLTQIANTILGLGASNFQ